MNENSKIARQHAKFRKEARQMADDELIGSHSDAILRIEAMIREGADRLDKQGKPALALRTVAELHRVQAAHAALTGIALEADTGISTRSGER